LALTVHLADLNGEREASGASACAASSASQICRNRMRRIDWNRTVRNTIGDIN